MTRYFGQYGRLRAEHMEREHRAGGAGRLIMGEVPGVVSQTLHMGGQPKTAALR